MTRRLVPALLLMFLMWSIGCNKVDPSKLPGGSLIVAAEEEYRDATVFLDGAPIGSLRLSPDPQTLVERIRVWLGNEAMGLFFGAQGRDAASMKLAELTVGLTDCPQGVHTIEITKEGSETLKANFTYPDDIRHGIVLVSFLHQLQGTSHNGDG